MKFRTLSTVLICCSATLAATAQQERLHLEELLAETLRKNPEILAAQKHYEAARQRPGQQSSLPDPLFALNYSSTGSPRPIAGLGAEAFSWGGFTISQELPFPGKRKLRGDIALKEAEAEFQQYGLVQLSVISRTKQAYHRLHHTYAALDVLRRSRDLLEKFLRVTEARYTVGRAAQQDVLKAQTQLSILETRLLRMEQDQRSREAEINSLLARPTGSPLARPADIKPGELRVTLEELFAEARQEAPALRREQKMIERTELALNLARKEYYPDYRVSGGYFYQGRFPDFYQFQVELKLPAYFWRKQRAGVAEQAHNLSLARRNFEATDQTLHFRIKDEYLMAQASSRLMKMYADTVVPQASLTLESSLASYETGAVDFLSVLTNFMTMVEYELNYHEEMLNFSLSLVRLEEITGLPLTN